VTWSFGPRRAGTIVGHRVFLDPTQTASYGHVERDTVLDTADRLPLETTLTPRRQR
jgi:hypothetical protein